MFGRVARFVTIYGAALSIQMLVGIATTIVVVNHLVPAAYGVLGLYLLVPATVMVVANIGLLQGTNYVIFSHTGEDAKREVERGETARRALGTGLVLSIVFGVVVAGLTTAAGPLIVKALKPWPHSERLILIGALGGAIAGAWRFVAHTLHYGRHVYGWSVAHVSRAFFSLGVIVVLLADGLSVEGVMLGFLIGSLAGLVTAAAIAHRHLAIAFDRRFAREILHNARGWAPIVVAYHVILSFGIYFLSLSAGASQLGLYSLAASIASVSHYAVSASIYSSGPMRRSSLRIAAVREVSGPRADAYIFEGYAILASFVLLALGLFADVVVKVAPTSYAGAASLVPMLALPGLARGFFAFGYSLSERIDKGLFQRFGLLSLALFVVLAPLLAYWLKAYGIAIAGAVAFTVPALIEQVLTQRSSQALLLSKRRMIIPFALAGALVPLEIALNPGVTVVSVLVKFAVLAAFAAALVALRVIPFRRTLGFISNLRRDHGPSFRRLQRDIGRLAPTDATLLRDLLREHHTIEQVALERRETEQEVQMRFMTLLRALACLGAAAALDYASVSAYLLFNGPYGERDYWGRRLVSEGTDPLTLDRLEQVTNMLKRIPARAWTRRRVGADPEPLSVVVEEHLDTPGELALVAPELDMSVDDAGDDG